MSEQYQTIAVRFDRDVCFIRFDRPEAQNSINDQMVAEMTQVVDSLGDDTKVLVIEGSADIFCFGADFKTIGASIESHGSPEAFARSQDPEPMYDLWLKLATGPFISVAHVRGRANAGGIGFVAACDVVLCEQKAMFSLSELVFGLIPACVMPFLIRKMGFAKANYLTLMTQPIGAEQAREWGLVDICEADSTNLLRKQLLRLGKLSASGIARYKKYLGRLDDSLYSAKAAALEANLEVFSDHDNLEKIARFVKTGQFPWE